MSELTTAVTILVVFGLAVCWWLVYDARKRDRDRALRLQIHGVLEAGGYQGSCHWDDMIEWCEQNHRTSVAVMLRFAKDRER